MITHIPVAFVLNDAVVIVIAAVIGRVRHDRSFGRIPGHWATADHVFNGGGAPGEIRGIREIIFAVVLVDP